MLFQRICFLALLLSKVLASRHLLVETPPSDGPSCCEQLAAIGFESNLPVVILNSGSTVIEHKIDSPIQLCTCNSTSDDYNGPAIAKGRGNSSADFKKKSFKIDVKDEMDEKVEIEFLGMPKDEDWILYGTEPERSLALENYLAYNLARASGEYAARTVYCEVFLVNDGQPLSIEDYNGVYLAVESLKRLKVRVNVEKWDDSLPGPEKGGWLFAYDNDNIDPDDLTAGPAEGIDYPFVIKEPSDKDVTPEALAFLIDYVNEFQDALNSSDWLAENPPAYLTYINQTSWIDYFLLVELTKNPDAHRGSTYFHKDVGGPIMAGPVWDYNEAFGMCCGYPIEGYQDAGSSGPGTSGGSAISPNGWRFNICEDQERCVEDPDDGVSKWYRRLWQDPQWRGAVGARWEELRAGPWTDAAINGLIDGVVEQLDQGAQVRNYNKYKDVLDVSVPPGLPTGVGQWMARVEQLRKWVLARVAWMDEELQQPALVQAAGSP